MIRSLAIFGIGLSLASALGENIGTLELTPVATVGTAGILLSDVAKGTTDLPKVVLAPAPAVGRPLFLSKFQIRDLLGKQAPDLQCTNWAGPDRIRIVRASRVVDETMLKDLLTATLQAEQVKDRGELELRFASPWNALAVPDDSIAVKILELPSLGVTPNFVCRFELLAGGESIGTFQQPVQARIFKEICVARSGLTRGQLLRDADIALERRDILGMRDFMTQAPADDPYTELRENVQVGTPLSPRSLRLRAIIKRGRLVDALVQDEGLSISVKAEALEDGVPGQLVRVRNLRSKREFKGKVQDEQTVAVVF